MLESKGQGGQYRNWKLKEILASSVQSQRDYPTPKDAVRCQQGKFEFINQEMSIHFLCRLAECLCRS